MQLCDLVDVKSLDEIGTEKFSAMDDVGKAEPHGEDGRFRLITWHWAVKIHQSESSISHIPYSADLHLTFDNLGDMS